MRCMTDRAWIEIDLRSLEHNVQALNHAMPAGCRMMAVVKADAYGHGAEGISAHLEKLGVDAFAVATADEGIALRKAGICSEILILGHTDPCRAGEICQYDLTQTLVGYEHAFALNQQGYPIWAHIKIDTGMHRLGFDHADTEAVAACFSWPKLEICGIFSHLCAADSLDALDVAFTQLQLQRFYRLLDRLSARGIAVPKIHLQSSYGLLNYPELKCDYVRTGIALYGVHSSLHAQTKLHLDLRPVLALRSRVAQIRAVSKGEPIGYGRNFVATRESKIAIIPIGYADGVPRALSCGKGRVLIHGCQAPIVGRICMDQLTADVTDIPGVHTEDVVTLIGRDQTNCITAEEWAERIGSISNEILSRLGPRLKIVMGG